MILCHIVLMLNRSRTAGNRQRRVLHLDGWSTWSVTCIAGSATSRLQRQRTTRLHVDVADVERDLSSSVRGEHLTDLFRRSVISVERLRRR